MLRAGASWSPYLRRALFPASIDPDHLSFLTWPSDDPATDWLAMQPAGAPLDLLGPLGNGFALHRQQRRLLLVAEAPSAAPLLALISPALASQASLGLLVHATRPAELLPAAALPPAVEYYTSCDDPLPGQPATPDEELARALGWADSLYAAGSPPFLRRIKAVLAGARYAPVRGFAQAVAPAPLPCGVGACLGCLVDTPRGVHRACARGPVFDLEDLAL